MGENMEIDGQGLTVEQYEDLLCDGCLNSPLAYYCPMCDYKCCLDCIPKHFRRLRNGSLVCKQCGNTDSKLDTFVGHGKV